MTREQAINYLFSSGFTEEQVGDVVRALTYEPTTKNDLGVDCISRADLIERINNAEEQFKYDHMEIIGSDDGDPFVDGVLSGVWNIREMVKQAPSVTPQLSVPEVTALAEWTTKLTKASVDAYNMGYADGMKAQEPRWIPVSEKKPNKGGEYLLWGKIDESEEEDYCFIGDYHEFDEVFGTEISNYDPKTLGFIDTEIEEYYSVVAWMPLPQSYGEVEE